MRFQIDLEDARGVRRTQFHSAQGLTIGQVVREAYVNVRNEVWLRRYKLRAIVLITVTGPVPRRRLDDGSDLEEAA
jgi:hypothetical protein